MLPHFLIRDDLCDLRNSLERNGFFWLLVSEVPAHDDEEEEVHIMETSRQREDRVMLKMPKDPPPGVTSSS